MIVQSTLNLLGETAIAAYAAAQKLQGIVGQPYVALGSAMATYSGQNAGAGDFKRIRDGFKKCMLLLVITVAITFVLARTLGGAATMLFVDQAETEVIRLSEQYFSIATWFYLPLASIFIFRNALQGIGFGVDAMIGGVFELAARALLIKIIGTGFGYAGICFCDPAAWVAALIPLIPLYYYRMKQAEMRRKGLMS
jgi:Na+-driven multidrug efflux pump